jgi:hypothetical protein
MRRIMCPKCAVGFDLTAEEEADGMMMRRTYIDKAKRPEDPVENQVTIISGASRTVISVPSDAVLCDSCNTNIYCKPAVAVSIWDTGHQPEPDNWEDGFKG